MILDKVFNNRVEIEEYCINLWNIKFDLNLNFCLNKQIRFGSLIDICIKVEKVNNKVILHTNTFISGISRVKVFLINPITLEEEWIKLSTLYKKKYHLNQKIFKSIYYKTQEYQTKIKTTFIDKYGKEYNKTLLKKRSKTMEERYGVSSFLKRGDHYKKIENIMIKKYGNKIPIKNSKIKDKISKTIHERYNVNWFLERGEHYKKIEDIMIERHGEINAFLLPEIIKYNSTSKLEKQILNEIVEYFELFDSNYFKTKHKTIFYETESKKKWYVLDFFNKELNLVIEINGDYWHCNPKIFTEDYFNKRSQMTAKMIWEKDLKKKQLIVNNLNCDYFTIWESDWIENKQRILNHLAYVIKNKKDSKS